MPMPADAASQPEAPEAFPHVPPVAPPLETTEGSKGKHLEPRPPVLESLTPVTPSEQRKLLPKAKAKGKAKAKPADGAEPAKKRAKKTTEESEPKTGDKKKRGRPPSKSSVTKGKVETSKRPRKSVGSSGSAVDGATVARAASSAMASNDTKKKASRKSSAYHTAKRAAIKDGKSLEEAKAIGKKVAGLFNLLNQL